MEPNVDPPPEQNLVLPANPPFIWPETRWHARQGTYEYHPPTEPFLADADLINGVLVGAAEHTVEWLHTLIQKEGARRISLVVVVYPAGPTREEHLLSLKAIQEEIAGTEHKLEVRIMPLARAFGRDFEKAVLPPTVLQAHDKRSGETLLSLGSIGDCGWDDVYVTSFNVVFRPDDGLRDRWRQWFQYLFSSAAPLTDESVRIPHLVPAEGDPAAAEMWAAFECACCWAGLGELATKPLR